MRGHNGGDKAPIVMAQNTAGQLPRRARAERQQYQPNGQAEKLQHHISRNRAGHAQPIADRRAATAVKAAVLRRIAEHGQRQSTHQEQADGGR